MREPRIGRRRVRWRHGAAGLLMIAAPAGAQVAPTPGAALQQVAPPNRSEVERVPVPADTAPHTRLTISGGIERAPCPLDAPRFAAVQVTLAKVVFDQLGPVDPASLDPAWRSLVGQKLPLSTICEIRDAAATILRRQGYLAAVQVPPQRIADGTIRLSVLMARLVAVHVRGNAGHAEQRLAGYLERLKSDEPFNQKVAERALLLAGDLPGFDVHLTLRSAGTAPGEVVGDVTVVRTPFVTSVNIQNYGSSAVGRTSVLASVQANDLLGLGDRAIIGVYNTADVHEQTVVQGSWDIRPGSSGLMLGTRATYAITRPDIGGGDPVRARTVIGTVEASYPLVRRQALSLHAAGGLDVIGQTLRFGGLPFTDDQLRMLYLRLDVDASDPAATSDAVISRAAPRWRAAGAIELRQGIAGLGASHGCGAAPLYLGCAAVPSISRLDADPQATLIRASGSVSVGLLPSLTLAVSPRAQIAFDPLLSFEQFTAGNYTVGRGYDPGALTGDSGLGTQTELRLAPLAVPRVATLSVQPFAFVDMARVWTLGPIASVYRIQRIVTVGGGGRFALADHARAELLLTKPVGETPLPGQDHGFRVLFSLTAQFVARR